MVQPLVEMKNISKSFGNNLANDGIDLHLNQNEILCLLGENGAGKTTLMKILYGQYRMDSGEIWYDGKKAEINSPRDAIGLGIQMVHQHFMLVPTLTVYDNIVLGQEPTRKGMYDREKASQLVDTLSKQYGLEVPVNSLVRDLSVGEQQRAEIIKALYRGAEVLILDEPTAVLTPQEVEDLFVVMRQLKADGKSIIIITHKLKETMAISDRVSVLRHGRLAGERKTSETNIDELSELMVGHKIFTPVNRHYADQPEVLRTEKLTLENKTGVSLKDIDLEIHEKEIVGIAGVEGNGQMELLQVLSGSATNWQGEIFFKGESLKNCCTSELIGKGISYIHADRHQHSVCLDADMTENYLLGNQDNPKYSNKGMLDWNLIGRDALEMMEQFDVRPRRIQQKLGDFSGGNQQKFVVGREICKEPCFIIAAHPTRGVDISATEFIHKQLIQHKEEGCGVLLISSDLDELMALSDRIAVIYDGKIVAFDSVDKFDSNLLGKFMGGGGND